jgi:formylglycine-generating enzyme required for sulfatase activity
MPRWFLSYHSPDQPLAERLKDAIEFNDSGSRVFFAPTSMRAGGSWTAQLAQELAKADAFILLIGEAGVGDWQVPEYDEALGRWVESGRTFPIIVILIEGGKAPGLPFLRQLHWIVTADPASKDGLHRLFDAVSGYGRGLDELWRFTSPYRGLEAMEEKDSDYFFGRSRETIQTLDALVAPDRLPVLIGNSGVGKSSLAQAGVLAALKRQAWPAQAQTHDWPEHFKDSRRWAYLSLKLGTDPIKALVDSFVDTWQFAGIDPVRSDYQHGWIRRLREGEATLSDLIDATNRRRAELNQSKPPAFFLYVDQGEDLYVRAEQGQRDRFSELLVEALADPRLRVMMSMRADFLGALQNDKALFRARHQIDVPPLGEDELREVVSRPAQLLGAHFEPDSLIDIITRRTVEDSMKDVGALPLLSYTLDDMWREMVRRGDGLLRLPAQSFELGGVLVGRANTFMAEHRDAEDALRRVFTLRLVTVREDGEPTRRRASRTEFSDEEWALVTDLSNYPYRLLVTATNEAGETFAQVAHEAIFRRWKKLREWVAAEREFLSWRSGLEAARRTWASAPELSKEDTLLMGAALTQARAWFVKRSADLPSIDRQFILRSIARENKAQTRGQRVRAAIYGLAAVVILGLIGWINQSSIAAGFRYAFVTLPYARGQVWPDVLAPAQEQALKPADSFRECAQNCPEMVVVPAGSFTMGGPNNAEQPQHTVTFARPFAVSKYEVTFADWDACVQGGGCKGYRPNDLGWKPRGAHPVINVNWNDAQAYVIWLSQVTGKTYRLLTEAEYEYAARGGTTTAYPWGDDIKFNGKAMANCDGCGSKWDNIKTAPVGSFAPNKFGLYDMVGNVFEWTEDCAHHSYSSAPADGSAWLEANGGDCSIRILRGGCWINSPVYLRTANRDGGSSGSRDGDIGFRIARTLAARARASSMVPGVR